jgi:ATP-binding protein involved in chromosome partitioning
MIGEQDVLKALQSVNGPDGKTPLPQSGAIAGLTVADGKIYLSIAVEPSLAPTMEGVRAAAEKALRALPGVANAIVSLTAEKSSGRGGAGPRPQPQAPRHLGIPGVARIIAVASGKGGVGKSTTAVNLALALKSLGWRIGILDLDIYGPSLPRLLNLHDHPTPEGNKIKPLEVYGIKAMSIGFMVSEEEAMVWRGPMVSGAVQQMLRDVAWGELDCLVIDMPPGTGDAQLTLAQTVPLSGAVIVSTPQDLALIDARRGVTMFNKVDIPVLGIVENMSYFLCPHCGERSDIFAHGGARQEAEKLGVPFLGEIPLTMSIREHSDAGRPVVVAEPESAHAKAYRAIAAKVKAGLEKGRERAAPKIVIG